MFVPAFRGNSWQAFLCQHREGGADDGKSSGETEIDSKGSIPIACPHVPILATLTKICLCSGQRAPVRATAFPMRKDIRSAVAQFPVVDGCFCDVDQECNASSQDANKRGSYPSLT